MREITEVRLVYTNVFRGAEIKRYDVYYTCQLTSKNPRNLRLVGIYADDEMGAYIEAVKRFDKYDRGHAKGRLKGLMIVVVGAQHDGRVGNNSIAGTSETPSTHTPRCV
jgi:hypothetical protein